MLDHISPPPQKKNKRTNKQTNKHKRDRHRWTNEEFISLKVSLKSIQFLEELFAREDTYPLLQRTPILSHRGHLSSPTEDTYPLLQLCFQSSWLDMRTFTGGYNGTSYWKFHWNPLTGFRWVVDGGGYFIWISFHVNTIIYNVHVIKIIKSTVSPWTCEIPNTNSDKKKN